MTVAIIGTGFVAGLLSALYMLFAGHGVLVSLAIYTLAGMAGALLCAGVILACNMRRQKRSYSIKSRTA